MVSLGFRFCKHQKLCLTATHERPQDFFQKDKGGRNIAGADQGFLPKIDKNLEPFHPVQRDVKRRWRSGMIYNVGV